MLATEGTYFLNADAAPLGEPDAEALCRRLPHEAGVVAIPLSAFTPDRDRLRSLARFAFCKRDSLLDEAGEKLGAWARGGGAQPDRRRGVQRDR